MSDIKGKIRDAIMGLSRDGNHDEATAMIKEVMAEKTKNRVSEVLDVDEGMHMSAGKKHMRAAHRHNSAGKKDMKNKRDAGRVDANDRVEEMNDSGSDSGVVKGKYDREHEDPTQRKGSVTDAKNIDHKDYKGKKPNAYTKKDAVDGKPVNEDQE